MISNLTTSQYPNHPRLLLDYYSSLLISFPPSPIASIPGCSPSAAKVSLSKHIFVHISQYPQWPHLILEPNALAESRAPIMIWPQFLLTHLLSFP